MLDLTREICICNSVTIEELVTCIKQNDFQTMEALLENSDCPVGDKCESCHEEGFENDGISLAMVLARVKEGLL